MTSARRTDRNCLKMLCGNWIFVLVVFCSMHEIDTLKDVKALIPLAVHANDFVTLRCEFNLEQDTLYTVKWYKGTHEFFRYVPKEDPQMQIFPLPGIKVDLSGSSMHYVSLLNLPPESSGKYLCEVTTDSPDFLTRIASGYMYVINVPEESPSMEITRVDEKIIANCTTPPSYPPMNVSWFLNGIRVPESSRRSVRLDPYSTKRETPTMIVTHLEKEIDEHLFQGGVIRVRCMATLFNLYASEHVYTIHDNSPQPWQSSISFTEGHPGYHSGSNNRMQTEIQIIVMLLQIVAFLLLNYN
ncbi:unnamed protein product [Ceutorhynchus assimilis]|uniref:Ig-like domain-containing protein n=1 Tax=Ceutorhynchus assimilis TaxID=467358 RepID=A0A9N9QI55_9CUCU|nr:unnamed protein product [Ceutorhynchus assimilis]